MEDQATGSLTPLDVAVSRVAGLVETLGIEANPEPHHNYIDLLVPSDRLQEVALSLRNQLGYGFLSMVTAVDYPDRIQVVYLAFTLEHPHGVFLRTDVPREESAAACPTLTTVWPGAEFQEREVYDMMGVHFLGHPDMTRILTEDLFPGHPLRKDFSIEPDYVLMRHLRHGVDGQLAPDDEDSARDRA